MTPLILRFITVKWDPIDWAIREDTDSLMSHTEALTPDNKWIGAHALTGVQARSYDYCKPTWERRYALPVSDSKSILAQNYASSMIGTPYAYRDIFGLLFRRDWHSNDTLDCSWFMYNMLLKAGIQALNILPEFANLVTPEMLHSSPIFIGRMIDPKVG